MRADELLIIQGERQLGDGVPGAVWAAGINVGGICIQMGFEAVI